MKLQLRLNSDGMVNVRPEKSTYYDGQEYCCSMDEVEFSGYILENGLFCENDELKDLEDGYIYGTVSQQ
jgi:hypothetical protein